MTHFLGSISSLPSYVIVRLSRTIYQDLHKRQLPNLLLFYAR